MEYPKTYEECPICHCRERIVETEVNEEKKEGKIGLTRQATSQLKILPIVDPTAGTIFFPVLKLHYDLCSKCGYEYPHIITKEKMTLEMLQNLMRQRMGIA